MRFLLEGNVLPSSLGEGTMSRKVYAKASHGLGHSKTGSIFARNHFASSIPYSQEVQEQITGWGLTRVAGNAFICESSKDFWVVKDGHIMKLVGNEVDAGESILAAPDDKPQAFVNALMDDLDF